MITGNEIAAEDSLTAVGPQADCHSVTLRKLHVEIVREQLATSRLGFPLQINAIELTLCRGARLKWAELGLTLAERDAAAAELVRRGEARYEALIPQSWANRGKVLHLVAVPVQAEAGR